MVNVVISHQRVGGKLVELPLPVLDRFSVILVNLLRPTGPGFSAFDEGLIYKPIDSCS